MNKIDWSYFKVLLKLCISGITNYQGNYIKEVRISARSLDDLSIFSKLVYWYSFLASYIVVIVLDYIFNQLMHCLRCVHLTNHRHICSSMIKGPQAQVSLLSNWAKSIRCKTNFFLMEAVKKKPRYFITSSQKVGR